MLQLEAVVCPLDVVEDGLSVAMEDMVRRGLQLCSGSIDAGRLGVVGWRPFCSLCPWWPWWASIKLCKVASNNFLKYLNYLKNTFKINIFFRNYTVRFSRIRFIHQHQPSSFFSLFIIPNLLICHVVASSFRIINLYLGAYRKLNWVFIDGGRFSSHHCNTKQFLFRNLTSTYTF